MPTATKACVFLVLVVAVVVAGCGGGSQSVVVTLSPGTTQSAVAGQSFTITATVANDNLNKGVTWTLSGPGTLSAQTATSVTYTAPSPIATNAAVTITATSASDAARSSTVTINLQAVAIALTPGTTQTDEQGQTTAITAAVSNDPGNKGVTWSLTGAGALSGQTVSAVTYTAPASITAASTATVTATSVFDGSKTSTLTINLVPPPSVTTTTLPTGTVSAPYTTTNLAATGGVTPYAWTVTSAAGTFPAGLTLSGAGAISGTPTAFGTFNFTVQVKDANNFTASANLSIKINPAPVSITTTSLPNGVANASYSANLQATGGAPPITWSVTAGALPAGLLLNAATGAISGTPTTAGTSNFTVQAADSSTPALTATKALSITIIPVLSITTSSLPNGITSTAYSATLASTGGSGAVTWSVTLGALPAGLSLNATSGAITGTPTTAGTSSFTVQAADSGTPQQKVTQALSITIVQQLVITNNSLPTGAVNSVYSATLASSGGTPAVTWAITVGTLPAGLTLNAATGGISGTPTTAGTSNFTVQATDSGTPQQIVTRALLITINPVLAITTTTLPSGTTGAAYNQTVQTNGGGTPPLTWSVSLGALPGGLTLNTSTGAISGTPTAAGTFNFTVLAKDSSTPQQTAQQALSIAISAGPLAITPATLPQGAVNEAYPSTALAATGGIQPYTWTVTSAAGTFPPGLVLSSAGQITGTPTTAGTFNFTVKVTDSTTPTAQTVSANFSIIINAALAVTTTSLPNGTVGTAYASTNLVAAGGVTPYTWTITSAAGTFPPGLTLSSGGQITGQPTSAGTFNFTVQVADAASGTATANLSIIVNPAPPLTVTTTSGSLPQGTINTAYPATNLNASGGIQPYTWTISAGVLPTGMSLSAGGQITGTPTVSGTFNFTAKVTDSATPTANTATAALSITVNANPCAGYGTGNEAALNGQYAFLFQGFNGSGATNPFVAAGSFAADGTGNITAGDTDVNQPSLSGGPQHQVVVAASSSYKLGSDNRGCMVLSFGGSNSVVLHFAVGGITAGVASKGRVIEFDDTNGAGTRGSGIVRLQTKTDFLAGRLNPRYAFGLDGFDSTGGHVSIGGSFSTASAGTTITNGFTDVDDAGVLLTAQSGATGTIGAISSTSGRAAVTYNAGVGASYKWVIYIINAGEIFIVSSDVLGVGTPVTSGRAIVTGSSFSSASLNGHYLVHLTGSSGGLGSVNLGLLNFTGGTLSGTLWEYSLGSTPNARMNTISGATYAVDATSGRVTLTAAGNNPPVLYLTTPTDGISAFIIGTDNSAIFGLAEFQPAVTYSTNSLSGNGGKFFFGNEDPGDNTVDNEVGTVTITPSTGAITGLEDSSQPTSPFLKVGGAVSGTFVINADGSGNLGVNTVLITNGTKIFFIDESGGPAKIVVVEQ